jgi:hypothetical protein
VGTRVSRTMSADRNLSCHGVQVPTRGVGVAQACAVRYDNWLRMIIKASQSPRSCPLRLLERMHETYTQARCDGINSWIVRAPAALTAQSQQH